MTDKPSVAAVQDEPTQPQPEGADSLNRPEFSLPPKPKYTRRAPYWFALLVLPLLVIGVSFAGYRFYVSRSAAKEAQPKTSTTTPKGATAPQQYLDIQEWGVKLPLSDPIRDLYYVDAGSSNDEDGLPGTFSLSLVSLNPACGTAVPRSWDVMQHALVNLVRTLPTDTDPVSGKLYSQLEPAGVTLGGYYIGLADVGLKNGGKTCVTAEKAREIDAALVAAVKGMVPDGGGWSVYKSNAGGFQFLYPKGWKVTESQVGSGAGAEDSISINPPSHGAPLSNGRATQSNTFSMTLWVNGNQDYTDTPAAMPNGSTQKLANAINLWTSAAQYSSRMNGGSTMYCPEMEIVGYDLKHFSARLPNGKFLSLQGGYCGAQASATTLTYDQQLASQEWQTATSIVQWIHWLP